MNNTFYNNQVSVQGETAATAVEALNNIFANDGVGILIDEDAGLESAYNTFDGFGPAVFGQQPGEMDYSRVPAFVDPENGNFHLRGLSPVRNVGDPDAVFNNIDGTRNDLGADGGPTGMLDTAAPQIKIQVSTFNGPRHSASPSMLGRPATSGG